MGNKRLRINIDGGEVMWLLDEIHPLYGKVVACGVKDGEAWRMLKKNGVISLIPLELL